MTATHRVAARKGAEDSRSKIWRPPIVRTSTHHSDPALWKHRIPKLNTAALAGAFESLLGPAAHTLDFITSPRATKHVLHFKAPTTG